MCDKHSIRPLETIIAGRPASIKQAILKCTVCKSRFTAPDTLHTTDMICEICGCDGMLVYTRDATITPPKKPEELLAEKLKREKK